MRALIFLFSFFIHPLFLGEAYAQFNEKNLFSNNEVNNSKEESKLLLDRSKAIGVEESKLLLDRSKAIGVIAGINCAANINNDGSDLTILYKKLFKENEITYLEEWIQTSYAKRAVDIVSEYFDKECNLKLSDKDLNALDSRIMPYLFDISDKDAFAQEKVFKLRNEANIALINKDFKKAEKKELEALKISEENKLSIDTITRIYLGLAKIYEDQEDFLNALRFYKKAEQYYEVNDVFINPLYLWTLVFKMKPLFNLDKEIEGFDTAKLVIESSKKMINRFPLNKEYKDVYILALRGISLRFYLKGDIDNTDKYAREAIEFISKYRSPKDEEIADFIGYQMGARKTFSLFLKPEDKVKYIELAKTKYNLRQKVQGLSHPETIEAREQLGTVYIDMARFNKGLFLLIENLELIDKIFGSNSPEKFRASKLLAQVYSLDLKDYRKALPLALDNYKMAIKLFGKNSDQFVSSTTSLALIYERLNQLDLSKRYAEEGYEVQKNLSNPQDAAERFYWALSNIYRATGDKKSLEILEGNLPQDSFNFDPETIKIDKLLRVARFTFKLPIDKRILFLEKLLIAEKRIFGNDSLKVLKSESIIASLYYINNDIELAEQKYEEIITGLKNFYPEEDSIDFLNPYIDLAEINLLKGNKNKAKYFLMKTDAIERKFTNYTAQNLDENSRLNFLNKFWRNKETIYNFGISNEEGRELLFYNLLNTKGVLADLERKQAILLNKGNDSINYKYSRLKEIIKLTSNFKLNNIDRQALLKEKNDLEVALFSELPLLKPNDITLSQVSSELKKDSVLIEFVKLNKRDLKTHISNDSHDIGYQYYAVIVYPNSDINIIKIGEASKIDDLISQVLISTERVQPEVTNLYLELSKVIVDPIISKTKGYKTWFLSPDGELNRVPFSGLFYNQSNKYLSEVIDVRLLTSGRELIKLKQKKSVNSYRPLVVANPSFNKLIRKDSKDIKLSDNSINLSQQRSNDLNFFEWSDLPGTAKEGEVVAKITNANLLTGLNASVSQIEKQPSPLITHIASHSYYLPNNKPLNSDSFLDKDLKNLENPLLRSGIVLAGANNKKIEGHDDGFLTALEVTKFNWDGTEMVIISGCESGKGDIQSGEGVYGLKRAIAVSGARSSLLSLWKVDDKATYAFMKSFYLKLKDGKGKGEALSLTQKEFRNHPIPGLRHPYVWAAFQLSGDWRPINW